MKVFLRTGKVLVAKIGNKKGQLGIQVSAFLIPTQQPVNSK